MCRNIAIHACSLLLMSTFTARAQMMYHAKIVVEGGSTLPQTPQIVVGLSHELVPACHVYNVFGNGTVSYAVDWRYRPYDKSMADACPVVIRLPGYQRTETVLRDGAVITLKRVGDHESSTVSMTALKAPETARKAYDKGLAAMSREKWASAQKEFERAVSIYPEYASAWDELGEALREQSKADEARAAYEHAIQADAKYLKPYLQLARLALNQGRNQDAITITDRALALNPIEYPGIFFFNAVANFNLKHFEAAETSVRRAVDLDANHEIPRAEYLLGNLLQAKGDGRGALEHLRKYVEYDPKSPDVGEVKTRIQELERAIARQ